MVLAVVVGALLVAAILGGLAWLGRRVRRNGRAGGQAFMGAFEEIWHPAAHRARFETETVEERMLPSAAADDQPGR